MLLEGHGPPTGLRTASLSQEPVRLRGDHNLVLTILHAYAVEESPGERGRWTVQTAGYDYEVQHANGRQILSYHWHLVGQSWATFPHLHIAGSISEIDVNKAHFPTGLVALQEFLQFVIRDLGVRPLRPDWRDILALPESEAEMRV